MPDTRASVELLEQEAWAHERGLSSSADLAAERELL